MLSLLSYMLFFFLSWPRHAACRILIPPPGIKLALPAVEAQSLNHRIAREVPILHAFKYRAWDFPGNTVVKTPRSTGGWGLIPGQGTRSHMHAAAKSSHATTKEPGEPQLRSPSATTKEPASCNNFKNNNNKITKYCAYLSPPLQLQPIVSWHEIRGLLININ